MNKHLIILSVLWMLCISAFAQREHIVQRGETIESIAQKYGVRVDELEAANPIAIKYFYVCTPLVIPVHVPNEEEIRAMEAEKARLIALREQEEAEKAERRARRNRFWGGLFGAVAEAFAGVPNQPTISHAYTPSAPSSSYTPQLAPMYNVNGRYICEPYYTPSPRMVQYNTQPVSSGPNPFNQQFKFTMIGEDKGPKMHFELIGDTEKKKQEYIDQYKKSHPNCSEEDALNAWNAKQDREFEQMQRQTEYLRQLNAQNQQNINNSSATNTATQKETWAWRQVKEICGYCRGDGTCHVCGGDGDSGMFGYPQVCSACNKPDNEPGVCPWCHGKREVIKTKMTKE